LVVSFCLWFEVGWLVVDRWLVGVRVSNPPLKINNLLETGYRNRFFCKHLLKIKADSNFFSKNFAGKKKVRTFAALFGEAGVKKFILCP
jgi:hypothetical protein